MRFAHVAKQYRDKKTKLEKYIDGLPYVLEQPMRRYLDMFLQPLEEMIRTLEQGIVAGIEPLWSSILSGRFIVLPFLRSYNHADEEVIHVNPDFFQMSAETFDIAKALVTKHICRSWEPGYSHGCLVVSLLSGKSIAWKEVRFIEMQNTTNNEE